MTEKFNVDKYCKSYFIDVEAPDGIVINNKTSKFVEKQIMELLLADEIGASVVKSIHTPPDIVFADDFEKALYLILAWKTGHINHNRSEEDKNIIYFDKAYFYSDETILNARTCINVSSISNNVKAFINLYKDELYKLSPYKYNDVLRMYKALCDAFINLKIGVGAVYAVTLLFFISNGKWPIYDSFVKTALMKLTDLSFTKGKDLSSAKQYHTYILALKELFGDEWQIHKEMNESELDAARNIDRALWVYGHKDDVRQNK